MGGVFQHFSGSFWWKFRSLAKCCMVQSCTYFFGVGLFRAFTMWLSMLNLAGRGISLSQTYFTKEPFFPLWNRLISTDTRCTEVLSTENDLASPHRCWNSSTVPLWMSRFLARQKEASIWLLVWSGQAGPSPVRGRRTPRLSGWTEQSLVRECWGLRHCPSSGGPKPGMLLFLMSGSRGNVWRALLSLPRPYCASQDYVVSYVNRPFLFW